MQAAYFFKVLPQYLVPQHLLSSAIHWLTTRRWHWLKNTMIKAFCKLYDIDLTEAKLSNPEDYPSFNAFFTRALKPEARPISDAPLISPADGVISQAQNIQDNTLVQAKCHNYTLEALLGGNTSYARQFYAGASCVIYLSPRDYHRIHMPCDGKVTAMTYVPGDLFAVNPTTVEHVDQLFARNERLIIHIETAQGPMALIMVGAIFVGSMETVWAGKVTPPYQPTLFHEDYSEQPHVFAKGEEIGRFNMGSTVILLTPETGFAEIAALPAPSQIKMGEPLLPSQNKENLNETDHSRY